MTKFPIIVGRTVMRSATHRIEQQNRHTLALALGPTNLKNRVIGFQLHSNLPTGGGNHGEWFGSFLPFPTGHWSAYDLGTNSNVTVILPSSFKVI